MKTESEIIQDYLNGAEKSIVFCENFFFMLVRITGLGIAYRIDKEKMLKKLQNYPFALSTATKATGFVDIKEALKAIVKERGRDTAEHLYMECVQRVDRDNVAFSDLEMYGGLPILKNHPNNNDMLSYHNLQENPIIGTIVRAFKQDSEIWGIAKIYDITLLESLEILQSTSPAIVSQWTFEKNDVIITAKESPIYLNHLAFVQNGFWDKDKQKPNSYLADSYKINKENDMAEKDPNATTQASDSDDNKAKGPATTAKTADSATAQVAPAATAKTADNDDKLAPTPSPAPDTSTAKTADNDDSSAREAIRKEVETELRKELESQIRAEIEAEYRKKAEAETREKELEEEKKALLDSAQETALDKERWALIARFRDIVDTAPESVGAKMPYLGNERLNPSATISKILAVNEGLYSPKYAKAIDSAYSEGTYALQKDAFENLIQTIQQKTADAYKEAKNKSNGFSPTSNPNVFIDANF